MSVNGKFDSIARSDLLAVADRFSVPHAAAALDQVKAPVAAWPDFARESGLTESKAVQVQTDFRPV